MLFKFELMPIHRRGGDEDAVLRAEVRNALGKAAEEDDGLEDTFLQVRM